MDLELTGKRAIVTGGSRGIGKAIARALALEGADVALLARDPQALRAAATELAAETGRKIIGVVADTRQDEAVRLAVAEAGAQLGGSIDILVNAAAEPAGYVAPPKVNKISGEYFHAELDVKVMGYIRCAAGAVDGMKTDRRGRTVNISGVAARQGAASTDNAMDGWPDLGPAPKASLTYVFEGPPARGKALEVVPGVHWIRMPLPYALNHINLWALDDGEGWAIVDTGVRNEETVLVWRELFANSPDQRPLTRVFVTHMHPDHVERAGAPA